MTARTPDHHSAEAAVQRALVGLPVSEEELERALDHIEACPACSVRFEVRSPAALEGMEEPDMARVQPTELLQRALIAALASPETIARRRAVQRLGGFEHVGIPALEALAGAASEDPEKEVREAALVALDGLDEQVSIPQRLIEVWSASPAEAAPFIASVLSRLATTPGVTRLAVSGTQVTGDEGVEGRVTQEGDELWLELNRLPASFERTSPVVALPRTGLVPAAGPVAQGSLRVRLGRVEESPPPSGEIYLLSPQRSRQPR